MGVERSALSILERVSRGIPHKLVEEGVKSPAQRTKECSDRSLAQSFGSFAEKEQKKAYINLTGTKKVFYIHPLSSASSYDIANSNAKDKNKTPRNA